VNGVVLWSPPLKASTHSVQEYREWETSNADRAFLQMCEDQALLDNFTKTTDEQSRLIKEADDEQYMKDCLEVSSFP
jgi:hypothetical protein